MTEKLKPHLYPFIALVVCLLAYAPAFQWMWYRWFATDSYYSHGVLIPFFTLYLIWQKRDELKETAFVPTRWGIALIVAALLLYLPSAAMRIYSTAGFSLLIAITGIVLHFYGKAVFKQIWFPILFLFFMIPLPSQTIINLSFRLKLFAATIASNTLNAMGIMAEQQGSMLKMRHAYVIVDDVCSGLRSLIALTALGSVFAYWLRGGWVKKVILLLLTVPIAVVTNVCRIIVLCLISEIWGPEAASGTIHDATGFLVFILAFFLLYGASKVIEE